MPLHFPLPAIFLAGALLAALAAWACIRWVAPLGWLDRPEGRKQHQGVIPRVGGLALWGALILGQLWGLSALPVTPWEWGCLHLLALLGFLDDRFTLSAKLKALVSLGCAVALAVLVALAFREARPEVVLMGIHIPTRLLGLTIPLLTLWFWAIPQSFNLIDGMNGLAAGTALLITLSLQLDLHQGQGLFLLGGLTAVFLFNWPRARLFLGDCGAYLLGGLLSLMVLKTQAVVYPSHALWIFAYPVLDTFLVVTTRLVYRRPLGQGDRCHFHHHLQRLLGRHQAWAVPCLWIQGAVLALRPLYLPGSAPLAWGMLALMLGEGIWFVIRARNLD